MIEKVWMIMVPFAFGVVSSWGYLRLRSRKKRPLLLDGLFAWILFVVFAFIGELVAHALYPGAYRDIGDTPAQMGGLMISIFFSFLINPILYISFRRSSKEAIG